MTRNPASFSISPILALICMLAFASAATGPADSADKIVTKAGKTGKSPAIAAVAKKAGAKTAKKPKKKGPVSAKKLFGGKKLAASLAPRAIGFYTHGCLAGGMQLPATGPAWQAMRLSRNRNWGHPALVNLVVRLATESKAYDGWIGLLVGDLAQPRGGPMLSGHSSHQVGLDADIWLRQMPDEILSIKEREIFQPISMLKNSLDVNPKVWTDGHLKLIRRAASYPEVERIFVHRAIKFKLCETASGDRSWLAKVRPWAGHHYHMHVRIKCPAGSSGCKSQRPPVNSDGCTYIKKWHRNLKAWLARPKTKKKKKKVAKKRKPRKRRVFTMARLPTACRAVLAADDIKMPSAPKLVASPPNASPDAPPGLAEARSIMRRSQ